MATFSAVCHTRLGSRREQGVFREVDAARMGQLITDVIRAARGRKLSLGHDDAPEETRKAIDEFVLDPLCADPQ